MALDPYQGQIIDKSPSLETVSTASITLTSSDQSPHEVTSKYSTCSDERQKGTIVSTTSSSLHVPTTSEKLFKVKLKLLGLSMFISTVLFLYFILNIYAFITVMTFSFSTLTLLYTILMYGWYTIENGRILENHIFPMLPMSMKNYILESSLHDVLIDVTSILYCREMRKVK